MSVIDKDSVTRGCTVVYVPASHAGPGELSAEVEYTTSDAVHVIAAGHLRYAIAWSRVIRVENAQEES